MRRPKRSNSKSLMVKGAVDNPVGVCGRGAARIIRLG